MSPILQKVEKVEKTYQFSIIENYEFPEALRLKLIQQNNWTSEYVDRVLKEYLRFVHLAMVADTEMTPSQIVDLAWHMHLTFTEDYWERMIPMLPRVLHHKPCEGKDPAADKMKYQGQYQKTLQLYSEEFGESPPDDIWRREQSKVKKNPQSIKKSSISGNTTVVILVWCILGFLWWAFGGLVAFLGLMVTIAIVSAIDFSTHLPVDGQEYKSGRGYEGGIGDFDSGDSDGGDGGGCGGCGGCGG